jgi:hypothetical protein
MAQIERIMVEATRDFPDAPMRRYRSATTGHKNTTEPSGSPRNFIKSARRRETVSRSRLERQGIGTGIILQEI